MTLTLNSPITEEQWDMIEDVDFDHTDSITFYTKHGKEVEFVKRKTGRWIRETKHYKDSEQEFYYYEERCSECGTKRKIGWAEVRHCPMCGARLVQEGEDNDS